jgi:hypothetical protein
MTFCENGHNCQGACPKSSHNGKIDSLTASNGQSCYWFSNGCTVGCSECDGTHNHVGHGSQQFLYKGMPPAELKQKNITFNFWNPPFGDLALDPKTAKGIKIVQNCDNPDPAIKPTICDPRLRTMNTQAKCGSPEDIYFYSPWRAPGAAPVIDACGVAGGRLLGQGVGGAGAAYMNTSLSKEGDLGSQLPPMKSQVGGGVTYASVWALQPNNPPSAPFRVFL